MPSARSRVFLHVGYKKRSAPKRTYGGLFAEAEPAPEKFEGCTHLAVAELEEEGKEVVPAAGLRPSVAVDERVDHHPGLHVRLLQHELVPEKGVREHN